MFFWSIFTVLAILFIVSVIATLASRQKAAPAAAAAVFAVLAVIFAIVCSITTVDARAVGIQTAFGKYSGTVSSGLHFVAPWSSVEEFSTLTQNLHFKDKADTDSGDASPIPVAFKGGAAGNVEATVRWRISDAGAEKLWRDYKTFDNVRDNLIRSDSANTFRTEFSNYTPVDAIDGNNLNTIMANVQKGLGDKLASYGVTVDSIQVTNVALGPQAQDSLNRIVEANANIQRAQADQERAKVEAETNTIRQQSQTPEALQRYCLEIVNGWDAGKNGPLPATFNCQLDSTSQAQVLVGTR